MGLQRLKLTNFRLYQQTEVSLDQRLNLVTGCNASGKTSFLEAVHVLGMGRSFRSNQLENLIHCEKDRFHISGIIETVNAHISEVTVDVWRGGKVLGIDRIPGAKAAELARQLPLVLISPDSHFEFKSEARVRRSVLDWGLFHVEPSYQASWSRYHRALQLRNLALKDQRQKRARFAWDHDLAELGDRIQELRCGHVSSINDLFSPIASLLLDNHTDYAIRLVPGWNHTLGMAAALAKDRVDDERRGVTHSGPHRNDLQILVNGQSGKGEASHGQRKALFIALRLAQIHYLLETRESACLILIDDLPAELDWDRRNSLSNYLAKMPNQVIMTATEKSLIDASSWPSFAEFHVEQGTAIFRDSTNPEPATWRKAVTI